MNIQDILSKYTGGSISQEFESNVAYCLYSSNIERDQDTMYESEKNRIVDLVERIMTGKSYFSKNEEQPLSEEQKKELINLLVKQVQKNIDLSRNENNEIIKSCEAISTHEVPAPKIEIEVEKSVGPALA